MANIYQLRNDFFETMRAYDTAPDKYAANAISVAKEYLGVFISEPDPEAWRMVFYPTATPAFPFDNAWFSAYSIYILYKHNEPVVSEHIQQMLEKNKLFQAQALFIIQQQIGEASLPHFEAAMAFDSAGLEHYRSILQLFEATFSKEKQIPVYWRLLKHKSKPFRQLVADTIARNDAEAEAKAIEMLGHKSADMRQTTAQILALCSGDAALNAIRSALDKETNDVARDTLLQIVADQLPKESSYEYIAAIVASAKQRGKLDTPAEPWLSADTLPALYYLKGKKLSDDEVHFLLYRMSRVKEMRSETEARYILQLLDKTRSGEFAVTLIKAYLDNGAKPDHKYLLALAALTGDDNTVDKIRSTINRWIDESRYKMAEYGVGALALQGSNKALRWVEWYNRKYKSKKANVGAAASAALETAAEELNISVHELGDRIVPDFGFEGLFKHFTAGGENFRAFVDSNFKLAFFNEDNKKLKAVPANADAELKEELKTIAKEVKDITKSQSSRLEYYLIIQRKWSVAQWQQAFLQNPVMFIYATRILWGKYDKEGNLLDAFYCNEDTSLLNVESDEISLNEDDLIGIVHPLQLNAVQLKLWQQHFYDTAIEPIFPQLDRQLADLGEIDLTRKILFKYEGRHMQTGSIKSTLEKYGWSKGPVGDGGVIESFKLAYPGKNVEVTLEVEGVGAGYGWGMDEKLGRLYAADISKLKSHWSSPNDDKEESLVVFNTLPAIFLNEMFTAIERIRPNTEQKEKVTE